MPSLDNDFAGSDVNQEGIDSAAIIHECEKAVVNYEDENLRDLRVIHNESSSQDDKQTAINSLQLRNEKLCRSYAGQFYFATSSTLRENNKHRFELEECEQTARVALFKAIQSYDVTKSEQCKFSSYACNGMYLYLNRYKKRACCLIVTPINVQDDIRGLMKKYDISDVNSVEFLECVEVDDALSPVKKENIIAALRVSTVASTDAYINARSNNEFYEEESKVPINNMASEDDVEEMALARFRLEKIQKLSEECHFTQREKQTFWGRIYGVEYRIIAEKGGVTKECARLDYKKAIAKLQKAADRKGINLKELLDIEA